MSLANQLDNHVAMSSTPDWAEKAASLLGKAADALRHNATIARDINAIQPDFDGEDEDGRLNEVIRCLETAKRLARHVKS